MMSWTFGALLLLLLLAGAVMSSVPPMWPPDRSALDQLYLSSGGENWVSFVSASWTDQNITPCSRWGVSCDESGRVEALYLREIGMTRLGSEISLLTALIVLMLDGNYITQLPTEFPPSLLYHNNILYREFLKK
jgi:hypothetical protein